MTECKEMYEYCVGHKESVIQLFRLELLSKNKYHRYRLIRKIIESEVETEAHVQ